ELRTVGGPKHMVTSVATRGIPADPGGGATHGNALICGYAPEGTESAKSTVHSGRACGRRRGARVHTQVGTGTGPPGGRHGTSRGGLPGDRRRDRPSARRASRPDRGGNRGDRCLARQPLLAAGRSGPPRPGQP